MKRFRYLAALAWWWAAGCCAPPPVEGSGCHLRGGNKWYAIENEWSSRHGRLYYGSKPFQLKGINWHGMESDCRVVHGLWKHPLSFYLNIVESQEFNAIRVPLSFEVMEDLDLSANMGCAQSEPLVTEGTTVSQFLDFLLEEAQKRNMFVLFDLHSIGGQITEMPWTASVSEDRVVGAWRNFADRFGRHPAILGLEVKNEPHGPISTTDFHEHCAKVIEGIGDLFQGLYFIDGTASSTVDHPPWGGTFEGISGTCEEDPLCRLGMGSRLVFAPHVYGPDVRGEQVSVEDDETFERRFGFLTNHAFFNTSAIVVTEFGGFMREEDQSYFERWKAFVEKKNLSTGAFFWTLPPNSADTGGILLDDYETLNKQKLDFLHSLQPFPSTPC